MSTTVTTDLLADVDRMDAKAFASYLSEDCVLRFANADEVVGRVLGQSPRGGAVRAVNFRVNLRVGRR